MERSMNNVYFANAEIIDIEANEVIKGDVLVFAWLGNGKSSYNKVGYEVVKVTEIANDILIEFKTDSDNEFQRYGKHHKISVERGKQQ